MPWWGWLLLVAGLCVIVPAVLSVVGLVDVIGHITRLFKRR